MKKVLVISDTHGFHENLKKAVEKERPFDRVLHLGDTEGYDPVIMDIVGAPVDFVAGNCDWASAQPEEKTVSVGGVKIMMVHGHEYYVTTGMEVLLHRAAVSECQVFLFGHTHCPYQNTYQGVLVANPGSISRPRQVGYEPSYGVLTIGDDHSVSFEVRYMEK